MTTTRAPRPETVRESLVRRNAPTLLALARRLLRRDEPACAAVRAGFATALDAALELEPAAAELHLRRAVVEACLPSLRARVRASPPPPARSAPSAPWRELLGTDTSLLRAATRTSFDVLPDAYRIVLLLSDVEAFGLRQTAEWLELTPAAARERLHAARHLLLARVARAAGSRLASA